MKRTFVIGCLLPVAAGAALAWWGIRSLRAAPPAVARYQRVERGTVETKVVETGVIEALKKVEVKSKVSGRLARLLVQEGAEVRQGQTLALIDPTEINSQVAQIQAQLDGARARLEQAQRAVPYQQEQTSSAIHQAQEGLRSAQARLQVAEEQASAQPKVSASAIEQAEAALKSARESLAMLRESTHPQAVVQAQTAYDDARAAEENARRNRERQEKLLERGFVSQQVVDMARTEHSATLARMQQARKRLDLIETQNRLEIASAENQVRQQQAALETARANLSQVAITRHELEAARAAVEQAKAQLAAAEAGTRQDAMRRDDVIQARAAVVQLKNQLDEFRVRQGDTTILAPMSGVVTKRYIEQGELVASLSSFSSGSPILQISDLSRMLVKISVNEVDVHKIRPGIPVEISIDGAKGVLFHGRVSRVAPAAGSSNPAEAAQQAQSGSGSVVRFAVEVMVDRPDPRLKPGMSARCSLIIARRSGVLRLPSSCVEGKGVEGKVKLVSQPASGEDRPERTVERAVKVGLRGDSHIEILAGLKEGDQVKPYPYTGPKRKELDLNMD